MGMTRKVVVVGACRTSIGSFLGSLSDFSPGQLGAVVVREAVACARVAPDQVDEVVMGCVLDAGHGQGVARQAALWAGLPITVPVYGVNIVCGSSLKAIMLAA